MKKILILFSTLAVLLFGSCGKDFITVQHNGSEPLDEYFINEDRMYQGLIAAYDPLEWFDYFYQYNNLNLVSDIMADDIYCGGSNEGDQPILVKTHYYTASSTECCDQIWTIAYSGVNRACVVLEHVDGVPGMSDDAKKLYKAEATILKAYYYTILWKFWGNIPYYDTNLESPYFTEQLGHDAVYEKIVTRIEEAIDLGILPRKAAAGNEGRVTLAMAYMLYAETVMYQKDTTRYAKALGYMKDLIGWGIYSLVQDYASIWLETGEWCPESIWEFNYISEGGGRDWDHPIATGGTVYPVFIGIAGCSTTFADGWGFGPVAKSAYDMYEENDVRRDTGILNWDKFASETGATRSPRWQDTGYFLLKYIARVNGNHGYIGDPNMNYGTNQRIYRYSEALLNAAELSVLVGEDGSSYLKEVQGRAHTTLTACTIDNIIEERRKEFVGEGKRYWDLVRTGKAATVLTAANHEYRQTDWSEQKKYWPIPQSECDKDPKLVQNNY